MKYMVSLYKKKKKSHNNGLNLCRLVRDVRQREREEWVRPPLCSQAHLMSRLSVIWPHGPSLRGPPLLTRARGISRLNIPLFNYSPH